MLPIKEQAKNLAQANKEAEPNIQTIYWFPDDKEIRLVELMSDAPLNSDSKVHPFYFRAAPSDGLFAPSVIAIIHPNELGKLDLPEDWGAWDKAERL